MKTRKKRFQTEKDFPKKIIGNDGYEATFVELQPLLDGERAGVYRYPGGEVVHFLEEIKDEDVIEW